jgi:K+-sensing histidine kinase KdpD
MKILKILFPVSLKDTLITVLVLAAAGFVCSALRLISDGDIYVSMIFLLAVLIVSRYTDGTFTARLPRFSVYFA